MSTEPLLEAYGNEIEGNAIVIQEIKEDEDDDVKTETAESGSCQSSWLVIRWAQKGLVDPFLAICRRGLRPKQLATSAALGITLGIFPVYGVTAVLSAVVGALLRSRCNLPTIMLANLVATPVQLGLTVPFLLLGEWVSGGQHFLLTPNALWMAITGKAPVTVLLGLLHALIGWAILAVPIFGGLYVIFYPLFWCLTQKFAANPLVHATTPVSPHFQVSSVKDPEI
ncbi:hypothetical protein SUGI_1165700 [Cryptomeria japonica]|uniref:uncharacterized protein LOC131041430 n=1 Tax=Cryptomeria japonica TaxID=3369 RepID=UPI00241478CF|nr:uncharacterized protein LOC131041430 [Cryptomeria japonica]GLJ54326.1 hypothetical protein SUGI_1165700 [Cryptomeria japonica]